MIRKILTYITLIAVILFAACGNNAKKDVLFDGKYPRITTISYSENGENYEIPAIAGHCIVFFTDTVSQPLAKEIIKAEGGKIIEQIPAFNYYLVKVSDGKESEFVTHLNNLREVEYAYFNTLIQLTSDVFILDDFIDIESSMLTTHGNGVRKTFSKYSISDDIHSVNMVFLNDNDSSWKGQTTVSNIILSELLKVAKEVSNEDLTLVNMSFGPALPGKKEKYDDYNDIDTNSQKTYIKLYAKHLEQLAVCFDKMRSKGISNFIITKSSGNESMHEMQTILDMLNETTISSLKDNLILVCAHDNKSEEPYSNFPSKKHMLLTTVDVSQEPWCGTSFAAPKLMGFIDRIHNKYENLNAPKILQAIRNATPENPTKPLTYEMLEREVKNIAEQYGDNNKRFSFRLELTSNYSGEWDLSDGNRDEIVRYEVHNTYEHDYLSGAVKGLYLENKTGKNLNIHLKTIDSECHIRPMHYTLAADEKEGFYAYRVGTMEILSVKKMEVQLSTW